MKNNYIEKTLSNGLKVYFYKDKKCKQKFVSYNINFGSKGYYNKFYYKGKEYEINPGIAHLLEHYLIEKSNKGNMLHDFKSRNLEFNGLTYSEMTSFYFLGIDHFEESLEDMINFVDNPKFDKDDFEEVKIAVIEELKETLDDKWRTAFTNNEHNRFKNFDIAPIANCTIGSVETTKNITLEELKLAYDAYYNFENKFMLVAGNIDIDKTLKLIEKIIRKNPPHPKDMQEYDYPNDFSIRKDREVLERNVDSDYVVISFKEKMNCDMPILKLNYYISLFLILKYNYLLDYIDELKNKKIIIGGLGHYIDFFKDSISLVFYTESLDSSRFENEVISALNLEGITEEMFNLEKKGLIVSELNKQDYIYQCFKNFAPRILFSKDISNLDTLNSLKYEEMIEVISKLKFDLKTTTIITKEKN